MESLDLEKITALIADSLDYKVGDYVYHNTPGGLRGVVISWVLENFTSDIRYTVAIGPGEYVSMYPEEMSHEKVPE